jgi:hypothetical protein
MTRDQLIKRIEIEAEKYGANNRHLKTSQHFKDGAHLLLDDLCAAIEALERIKFNNNRYADEIADATLYKLRTKYEAE